MRRGISIVAAVAALALGATACGDDGGDSSQKAKDPAEVSGTVTWWDTSDATNEAPAYQELIKQFEDKYPKIDVKYQNVPFADAEQKFKTAAQNGEGAPDVLRADVGWTPGLAALSYLAPLDGTAALKDTDDVMPVPAQSAEYDGKTYGAPQVTDSLALLYNKELFAKAGVAKPPTTWDELKTAAKAIKDKTGADALYLNPDSYFALPFVWGEGGDMLDVENKKILVDSPESVKGIEIAKELVDSGVAVKPDLTDGYNNMQASFKDGDVAMVINGPWSVADDFTGKAFKNRDNLGIAPVPGGSAGSASPIGGHNLVAYAGSGNLDAAYLFIEFMTSAKSQEFVSTKLGTLPTRTSAYTPAVTADPVKKAFKTVLDGAKARPAVPGTGDLFNLWTQNYTKILGGSASPEKGQGKTADQWKKQVLKDWS
ncbi:extracellular solute-binding protein [Streptomyces capparidis]